MKTLILFVLVLFLAYTPIKCMCQEKKDFPFESPSLGIKTNLLYDLVTPFNFGIEFKTGAQYTLELSANYNPWSFSNGISAFKNFSVQPEFRYWTCEAFNGHFFGLHGIYAQYNTKGVKLPFRKGENTENTFYQGDVYGGGIGYGYQWYLSPRWNLEAMLGMGYLFFDYKSYECKTCGKELYHKNKNYVGPTKVAISLIYIIK